MEHAHAMMAREIIAEDTARAGEKRLRVLSLLDRLHRDRAITFDQYAAGHMLRSELMRRAGPSEGVSSYGQKIGHADAATKADRVAQRLTGFWIDYDGHVYWRGGRSWNAEQRRLEDALFAACGVHDESGVRHVDVTHANILVAMLLDSEDMPNLGRITRQLTSYYGDFSRKGPAFALGFIHVLLQRLAKHFRLVK